MSDTPPDPAPSDGAPPSDRSGDEGGRAEPTTGAAGADTVAAPPRPGAGDGGPDRPGGPEARRDPLERDYRLFHNESPLTGAFALVREAIVPLAATIVFPAVPVAVLSAVLVVLLGQGRLAVADGALQAAVVTESAPLPAWGWVLVALWAAAALYGLAVIFTSSLLVAGAVLAGRPITARTALRRGAGRPWAMMLFIVLLSANGAVAWAAYEYVAEGAAFLGVVAAAVAFMPAIVLTYGAVGSTIAAMGPLRACVRMPAFRVFPFAWYPLVILLGAAGLSWPSGFLMGLVPLPSWAMTVMGGLLRALPAGVAVAVLAGLLAILFLRDDETAPGHDIDTVRGTLPADDGSSARSFERPAAVLAAGLAIVLVPSAPALAAPGIPAYTEEVIPSDRSFQLELILRSTDEGLLVQDGDSVLARCGAACEGVVPADGDSSSALPAQAFWSDGRLLLSPGVCAEDGCVSYPGSRQAGTEVRVEEEQDNPHPRSDYTAADTVAFGGGLVIASLARNADGTESNLQLHRCDGAECGDVRTADLGDMPVFQVADEARARRNLEIAVGPAGEVAVAVREPDNGSVTLVTCEDADCADPQRRVVVEPRLEGDPSGTEADGVTLGARTEIRPDGRPVVVYRAHDGSALLLDCVDTACSESAERELTGPGWQRPLPALAVDSGGRPQMVTTDGHGENLVFLSCRDGSCADVDSVTLRPGSSRYGADADLVLDERDRPVILTREAGERGWDPLVIRCDRPGCGASG
ncbi:hypothetical protein ACFO4E_28135 [Nocardiopsis mangrovi]|uniref:Uncharacterized protein n=1 Tax=Nocardiopsis mangrovi TaxID=1179818 RepID=A0ABV9E604_9ACTN